MTAPSPSTSLWRVVVADRVAGSGRELLSKTPDIEVIDVAGKPAELDRAIAGAHALIVRSETRVTASLMARAQHLRSEEHTSELQSQSNLVCRLLLEKKKNK